MLFGVFCSLFLKITAQWQHYIMKIFEFIQLNYSL